MCFQPVTAAQRAPLPSHAPPFNAAHPVHPGSHPDRWFCPAFSRRL